MTRTTSSHSAPVTTSAGPRQDTSGTPPTGRRSASIFSIDAASEQLATDAWGAVRPVGKWTRLGGRIMHALTGIHKVIPTVEANTEDGVLTTAIVQECAFCPWRA